MPTCSASSRPTATWHPAQAGKAVGAYLCRYAKVVTGAARQIGRNARDGVYNVVYTKEAAVQLAEHLYYPDCLSLARKQTAASSLASCSVRLWRLKTGQVQRPEDVPPGT
ncbi:MULTISPECIES: hypothetical protein [Streptomyces]|uniref:hypothetical protein n=1 Tax=Streptomyces TaxID=1883 RepID=UPI000A58F96D|nr:MULTISPECIES: hypothetical protein [Streptomyces]CAD5962820.1 conserved protein of unknown function [Streptomyces sp. KY75]CAD5979199.1 conserved protein of unknown function [Streptomyces sp. KY70]